MKLILFTSLALVVGMIIGCGSDPSYPAQSTAPETAREIAPTPVRGVTLDCAHSRDGGAVSCGGQSSICSHSRNRQAVSCGGQYRR